MAGITQCFKIACCDRNRRGGIKAIYLANTDDIVSTTVASTGCTYGYDAITMDTGKKWYKWEFDRGTAGFTANATRENGSTLIDVELQLYIPKVTCEGNQKLMELVTSCGITAVVETYADDCGTPAENLWFVLGWDEIFEETAYMEFTSGEQSTGVALQDANGTAITLTTQQGEYPRALTSAGITDVTADMDACA
jgi:hypothetical protein